MKEMLVTVYNKFVCGERNQKSRTVNLFCRATRLTNQTSCITSRDRLLADKA